MNDFYTALKFASWGLEVPLLIPSLAFVFFPSVISLVWAAIKQRPFRAEKWRPYHWLVFSHFLFFLAAVVVGVVGGNPSTDPPYLPHPPIAGAVRALDLVTYGSYASCVFWVWRMKGFRWFAVSLMIAAESITFGALFIAGMAVSGDWL